MEFGHNKGAALPLHIGKIAEQEETKMPNNKKTLGSEENYEYLGVWGADNIKPALVKKKHNQAVLPKS